MKALNRCAAKLPRVEISDPKTIIGKDTVASMQSGAICGFVGAVVYTIDCLRRRWDATRLLLERAGFQALLPATRIL